MELVTTLTCDRLFLRSLLPADASELYLSWLSNPEVNQYLEVRFSPPVTVGQLVRFISESIASHDVILAGIFLMSSGCHIGNIKLGPIDWRHLTADIGFIIGDSREWGKGYASSAIGLISDYAFRQLGIAKLTAGCYAENEGSRRALINAGFVEEGRRISQCLVGDKRQDGILLGKINPKYAS